MTNKILASAGLVFGIIVLAGFFSPWLGLRSGPFQTSEGSTLEDSVKVTGWNLTQGRLQVVQKKEMGDEVHKIINLQIESKNYPYLSLIGGILLVAGGISALISERKFGRIAIALGGLLALIGGFWGLIANGWVVARYISFGDYYLLGYYEYGVPACLIGGLCGLFGTIIEKST